MPFGGTTVTFPVLGCMIMMVGPSQTCDARRRGMLLRAQFWPQHLLLPITPVNLTLGECFPVRLPAEYPHRRRRLFCRLLQKYVGGT